MSSDHGLYVTLLPEGKLKRDLATESGNVSLEETTIQEELLQFLELDQDPYHRAMDGIIVLLRYLDADSVEEHEGAAQKLFRAMMFFARVLADSYETECPSLAGLLLTMLEDYALRESEPLQQLRLVCADLQRVLYDTMFSRELIGSLLSAHRAGKPLDFAEPYAAFRRVEVHQILTADSVREPQYHFRSALNYYSFLLLHSLNRGLRIQRCELCGHFFIPRSNRRTKYCDRIIRDGRTCKEVAPGLKHCENVFDTIAEDLARANRRMYKRYERALDISKKPSPKDLTHGEYLDWLERAAQAKGDYEAGRISLEDAMDIIDVP